mgnify:CR=1 FL=1
MKIIRLLLFPMSLLYALAVVIRNFAYDLKIFRFKRFSLPVISIGNLAVGGAGKSPMTEYVIRLLKDRYKVSTLSRGYGRKTRGFLYVEQSSTAAEVGDEPLQFKQKFPEITVAVCEKRVDGIEKLQSNHDVILMDDAFQHRAVKPGLSLLLFDYNQIFKPQWFLPTGDLREPLSGRNRADILVITKTPAVLSDSKKAEILRRIKPFPNQQVFFSYIKYESLFSPDNSLSRPLSSLNEETRVILLTGIANPKPLVEEVGELTRHVQHHQYPDHHLFTQKNILKLAQAFEKLKSVDKLIVTTEKDMQRLRSSEGFELLKDLPIFFLPISVKIHEHEDRFNSLILNYVTGN